MLFDIVVCLFCLCFVFLRLILPLGVLCFLCFVCFPSVVLLVSCCSCFVGPHPLPNVKLNNTHTNKKHMFLLFCLLCCRVFCCFVFVLLLVGLGVVFNVVYCVRCWLRFFFFFFFFFLICCVLCFACPHSLPNVELNDTHIFKLQLMFLTAVFAVCRCCVCVFCGSVFDVLFVCLFGIVLYVFLFVCCFFSCFDMLLLFVVFVLIPHPT